MVSYKLAVCRIFRFGDCNQYFNAMFLSTVPPHIHVPKRSENGNENDKAVLVCECQSYPLVTEWFWNKVTELDEVYILRFLSSLRDVSFCISSSWSHCFLKALYCPQQ